MKTLRLMRLGPVLSVAGCGTCWLGGRPMPVQCKVGGGERPVRGAGHRHSMHTPKSAAAAAHALTTASSTKIGQMVCQSSQPSLTPALQS